MLRLYSALIGGAFLATVGVGVLACGAEIPPFAKLAPLLALAIAGEELIVQQRQRSGNPALSFSAPAHVAAAVLLGPLAAALLAAAGVAISDGMRASSRRYIVLNASMFGLSTWVAGVAYVAAGGRKDGFGLPALAAFAALLVARYLMTSLILAGGIALATERSFFVVISETLWEEIGAAVSEGSLGVIIAFGLARGHWILFPFLVPLLAALYRSKSALQRLGDETRDALDAVARVIDERHQSTALHTERVAEYVRSFAAAIGLSDGEGERLVRAARFHDLGKIAVDGSTLSKEGRLSEGELAAIRRHPRLSAQLLSPFYFAREIADYVELHHERFDGEGYYRVGGDDIPIEAHVLIVADSFDAMTSARTYRPALSLAEAVEELHAKSGSQFHPLVARAFAAVVSGEPVLSALGEEELASLRAQFQPVRRLSVPALAAASDPRLPAILLAVAALTLAGIAEVPRPVTIALGAAAAAAAARWLVGVGVARRRQRRILSALAAGASANEVLQAAGISGVAVWLDLRGDGESYGVRDESGLASAGDAAEACAWARRRERALQTRLRSGRHLLLAPAEEGRPRLALLLERRPRTWESDALPIVAAQAQPEGPEPWPRHLTEGDARAERLVVPALLDVRLDVYEQVRRAAGQLVAERLVAEAERHMRAVLRDGDAIVKVGDDRFGIAIAAPDEPALDVVSHRVRAALEQVSMPRRVPPLRPRIRGALSVAVDADPEFRELGTRISLGLAPLRAAS